MKLCVFAPPREANIMNHSAIISLGALEGKSRPLEDIEHGLILAQRRKGATG